MDSYTNQILTFAQQFQSQINANMKKTELAFHNKMQKLLENPKNKVMLIELLDKSFRTKDKQRSYRVITKILRKYNSGDFFSATEKMLLWAFVNTGAFAPKIALDLFMKQLRSDTKAMVLSPEGLEYHIKNRARENITININLIGEEVLGEGEASYRMKKYIEALKTSYITYISIKITTIFSQINILDFEYSKKEVVSRLKTLYQVALDESKKHNQSKFINLDMEEFRDLELTVESFMEAISEFKDLDAGIVLQAYIPDSFIYLQRLFEFSKKRVQSGAKPIKIRIVKGANKESEETISSIRNWELVTFDTKVQTDSNYKKMLNFIFENDRYKFIKIGIASHNIFEIAYASVRIENDVEENFKHNFTFEMLEGMSLEASNQLSKIHDLILYAPICDEAHFNNAIAYLVRRLDENTSIDNFMRHFFNLKVNDENYKIQEQIFLHSLKGISDLDSQTRRKQDRNIKQNRPKELSDDVFVNEPDTDFILPQNRAWAQKIKQKYENLNFGDIYPIANEELPSNQAIEIKDKIHHQSIAKVHLASKKSIKTALKIAQNSDFGDFGFDKIAKILQKAAALFRERRGDLLGVAAREVGKTLAEIDPEISEAIDFIEFYPHALKKLIEKHKEVNFAPKGVGVVISPWNFPIGIPVGTIVAPLAAGNKVIFKPSSVSTICGYEICKIFWEAGIPKDALIFLPSKGEDISEHLLKSDDVAFAILTGGEDTAKAMLQANPKLFLSAETGGKNATIVSKMADLDSAVKNIVHSAFSNSGQKCSATSLLILEKEVYENEEFKKTLVDTASSLSVGNPFDYKNKLGALAQQNSKLKKALRLSNDESWALKPNILDNNPNLMTPGIKYGTKPNDFGFCNELFGPILSVVCANDLRDAIKIANQSEYGLTSALESLDPDEWAFYSKSIQAGNVYINKPSTGAIVLRQPFGGVKKSAVGFGRKVGFYNYMTQFVDIKEKAHFDVDAKTSDLAEFLEKISQNYAEFDADLKRAIQIAKSYSFYHEHEFSKTKEYIHIRGEDNVISYVPIINLLYRYDDDALGDALSLVIASKICGFKLTISYKNADEKIAFLQENFKHVNFVEQKTIDCAKEIAKYERIYYMGKNNKIYEASARASKVVIRHKPYINGYFQLLYFYNEKSISTSYHRYGNLGERAPVQKALSFDTTLSADDFKKIKAPKAKITKNKAPKEPQKEQREPQKVTKAELKIEPKVESKKSTTKVVGNAKNAPIKNAPVKNAPVKNAPISKATPANKTAKNVSTTKNDASKVAKNTTTTKTKNTATAKNSATKTAANEAAKIKQTEIKKPAVKKTQ